MKLEFYSNDLTIPAAADADDDDDGFVGQCLAPGHARSPFVVD